MLTRLFLKNFRNISELTIEEFASINVVLGPNGAGKTSLFEAIFTLVHGRSFRKVGGRRDALVSLSAENLVVYGEVISRIKNAGNAAAATELGDRAAGYRKKIGLSKSRSGETRIKQNGVAVQRLSEITEQLPIMAINTDTFDLLSGPPQERRAFLDWSVFHVEHSYKDEVRSFARALAQRNALLRSLAQRDGLKSKRPRHGITYDATQEDARLSEAKSELAVWTRAFAVAGEKLDLRRRDVFNQLNYEFKAMLPALGLETFSLSLSYRRGWDAQAPLFDCLLETESADVQRGFTSVGPHRCDVQITIEIDGQRRLARDVMSRGQLKLTVFALKLSQLRLLYRARPAGEGEPSSMATLPAGIAPTLPHRCDCVLLLDDIAAELDPIRLRILGEIIQALDGLQVFINGTTETLLSPFVEPFEACSWPIKKFHVEHGRLL